MKFWRKTLALLIALALLTGCGAQNDVSGVRKTVVDGRTYYVAEKSYTGEYDIALLKPEFDTDDAHTWDDFRTKEIMTLEEYADFCRLWDVPQAYTEEGSYVVYADLAEFVASSVSLHGVDVCDGKVTLYVVQHFDDLPVTDSFVLTMPVSSEAKRLEVVLCVPGADRDLLGDGDYVLPEPEKPILYLYPTQDTELTVTLGHPENVTCTYPAYDGSWQVLAHPDGTMEDISTGRSLYALYWEGKNFPTHGERDGFLVRGEDSAAFLEEKLAVLGLTEREAEEMIVYWLPRLEESPYNFIRFAPQEEIDTYMPLGFSVQPDSIIRVLMEYAPLECPISVEPQQLTTPTRTGFIAVEWGGMEIPKPSN